jgi:DNA-binding response OmpR family regulator
LWATSGRLEIGDKPEQDRAPMEGDKTILIIEDEPHIVLGLTDALEFEGFKVRTAEFGKAGIAAAREVSPDAVLLDLMLPDMNGYQVCQEIRRFNAKVPIIMLTARSQEADKIRGLDAGADDYVTKPFGVGELVARLRAAFRRMDVRPTAEVFGVGDMVVNLSSHSIEGRGRSEPLSVYEVELLRFLYERRGHAVSRDEILDRVWGQEANPTNRTIDNFIVKLRRKIELKPDTPEHIVTVYGMGYKLVL